MFRFLFFTRKSAFKVSPSYLIYGKENEVKKDQKKTFVFFYFYWGIKKSPEATAPELFSLLIRKTYGSLKKQVTV